ncbi:MAG: ATP-binding protein, partial [Alistipes sp.]|nr:ATP-binding protein [Alistipes sp.]
MYEIEEDGDGFIWIYTNSGLDRFDGNTIKHYQLDDSKESNNHILSATSMHCDFKGGGVLWIALKSGDIYRYNREFDSFVREYEFSDKEIAIYNFTLAADNTLVVCTNKGLYRCMKDAPKQEPYKIALDGKLTRTIIADRNGGFYIGTDNGVYHMASSDDVQPAFVDGTAGMHVLSLEISSGKLFVGTFSSGVLTVDTTSGQVSPFPLHIPSIPINAITAYGDDGLLLGVDGAGVYLIDARSGKLMEYYHDDGPADTKLSGNTVTDVHVDSRKGVWVSTSHCGLNYIPPYNHSVSVLKAERGNPASLISDYVNVIFEDSDGELWFGMDMGLNRYNPVSGHWQRYLQRNDYVANVVLAIGEDMQGRIWAGSYGNGVNVIDKHTNRVERIPLCSRNSPKGSGTEYVFAIRSDRNGNVWIGGINGDLTRYDSRTDAWHYYEEDCLGTIVPDADGSLLFGGNKGVGRYDHTTDRFVWTTQFDTVCIRYPVRCLLADTSADVLWIGTSGEGLIRYDRQAGTARRYTIADGLSTNTIYSIVRDHMGACWICTENDLYRIAPQTERLTRFTYYLLSGQNTFNQTAGIVSRNGSVLLGTAEGCVMFDPEEGFGESANSTILLTDFKLHDRSVIPRSEGSPLKKNINLTDRIELGNTQNNIEISFAAIDYTSPQRMGFEYMLEGVDRTYVSAGAVHSARYTGLLPGKYTFKLRAVDLYNDKVLDQRSLSVSIRQPLWLTWWAKLIYGVILAGGFVQIAVYVRNYNREKYIKMQIQTFTTMAHDIRVPMSLIKAPLLDIEMEKNLSEKVRDNLAYVRIGIDKTIGLLTEMLEIRHIAKLRKRLMVENCDIREYLQIKAEEYVLLAKFKNITIVCDIPDDMPRVMVDLDIIEHVIDNLMSNALKYTNQGEIRLCAAPARYKRWRLSVSDTGIGIARPDAKHIFKHLY